MNRIVKMALALACAAVPGIVPAAAGAPPGPQGKPLLIVGATLHTMSGAVIRDGKMLVSQGRIKVVAGPLDPVDSSGAEVLNLAGKHIYPGFIAANSALGLVEVASVSATVDGTETGPLNPNARSLVAVNADSEQIAVARANGVLAALAVPRSGAGGLIAGTSALIQLDGWNWEEMGLDAAVALHVTLPMMRLNRDLFPPPLDQRLEDIRKASAQRLKALEEAFESAAAYRRARASGDTLVAIDARWEAMLPVMEGKRPVFIRADDVAQIRYALDFAKRFGLKVVIVGGADAARLAPLLRERQVAVVIADVHRLPMRRDDPYDSPFAIAAELARAGVAFCIARSGSDFDAAAERNLPYEAATAVAHGLPRDEALKAITLYPARILGVADKLGALEPGRLASFIVTDGDPLEITTQVERVFVQGRELDMATRHTRLRDKYEERYRQLKGGR